MPVFLVADGTPATKQANSYASVADADNYLSLSREYLAAWTALAVAEKETYLMFASRLLDQTVDYTGLIGFDDLTLRWPRKLAYDCDALEYTDIEIPPPIKDATIEIAGFYATNTTINPTDKMSEEEGLKRLKIDVLDFTWKDSAMSAATANKYPSYISNTLRCLGTLNYRAMGGSKGIQFKQGFL